MNAFQIWYWCQLLWTHVLSEANFWTLRCSPSSRSMKWNKTPAFRKEWTSWDQKHIRFLWSAHSPLIHISPGYIKGKTDQSQRVVVGHIIRTGRIKGTKCFMVSGHWSRQQLSQQIWSYLKLVPFLRHGLFWTVCY